MYLKRSLYGIVYVGTESERHEWSKGFVFLKSEEIGDFTFGFDTLALRQDWFDFSCSSYFFFWKKI